jgi:hypothetical protein
MPMPPSHFPASASTRSACAPSADRSVRHFNQIDLSRRWNISPRTLERWRWLGLGPPYLKIGGRVVYRLEDIEAFEAERTREGKATDNGKTVGPPKLLAREGR